jgi:hypothetical protein
MGSVAALDNTINMRKYRASKRLELPSEQIDMQVYDLLTASPTNYKLLYKILSEYKTLKVALKSSSKSLEDVLEWLNSDVGGE